MPRIDKGNRRVDTHKTPNTLLLNVSWSIEETFGTSFAKTRNRTVTLDLVRNLIRDSQYKPEDILIVVGYGTQWCLYLNVLHRQEAAERSSNCFYIPSSGDLGRDVVEIHNVLQGSVSFRCDRTVYWEVVQVGAGKTQVLGSLCADLHGQSARQAQIFLIHPQYLSTLVSYLRFPVFLLYTSPSVCL